MTTFVNAVWMGGPVAVRSIIIDYLSETLPASVEATRANHGVNVAALPDVVRYENYKQFALDVDSLVEVDITRATDFVPTDMDGAGAVQFRSRYFIRLYAWCTNEGDEEVQLNRDLLAIAIRACLYSRPSIADGRTDLAMRSYDEAYQEPVKAKGDRWVSGSVHSFEVTLDEGLVDTVYGMVEGGDKTVVDARLLPPAHPAM